jgi:hypothetical protein
MLKTKNITTTIFTILSFLILINTANAVSTTLVISQVNSGGGGSTGTYLNDYVEIKNISTVPQSLNGLSLTYGSATGQFGSAATLTLALPNVTLNPGQYYLVQTGATGTAGAALPVTPDATTTNLSMAAAGGKVAITNATFMLNTCGATATPCVLPNAGIVDLAAWGTSNNAEGGASVNNGTALASTQGSVRKTGGCTETDNNNADFDVITASVPRNAASTATTCGGVVAPSQHFIDFNGDGKTDWSVVRNVGAGGSGATNQLRWFYNLNGTGGTVASDWGVATDILTPADFDGDSKTDLAIWRGSNTPATSAFYILRSATNTVQIERFGEASRFDNPTVVGDYDGDGKADVAVFTTGTLASSQSFFYYRGSLNNPNGNVTYVPWGPGQTLPYPGDFDGDGKFDFCVRTLPTSSTAPTLYYLLKSNGLTVEYINWGQSQDTLVTGDYDGDRKTDFGNVRNVGGVKTWYVLTRTGATSQTNWGTSTGDYDGDGKTDIGIWRSGVFWINQSSNGALSNFALGASGDTPVANFNIQ